MKLHLTCLLGILFFEINAQSYLPLPTHNTRWLETEYSMMGPAFDHSYCYFAMDTATYIMNGHPYKNYELITDSVYNPSKKFGSLYLYDDTTNRKVYIYTTAEFLFYDFSKNIGDTIRQIACFNHGGTTNFILDSIAQQNIHGIVRNVFYLSDTNHIFLKQTVWIEGIGSPVGLERNSFSCFGADPVYGLNCVHENGNQIYGGSCVFKTVDIDEYSKQRHQLFLSSNPILHHTIQLMNPYLVDFTWELISVDGKVLKHGNSLMIPIHEFAEGIYCLKIITKEGLHSTFKIVN